MAHLVELEIVPFAATRVIGKEVRHTIRPGVENPIPQMWETIVHDGTIAFLTGLSSCIASDPDTVGWMGEYDPATQEFVYIAGVLTAPGTPVPAGFSFRDLPACQMAIGWIEGPDGPELYTGAHDLVDEAMQAEGYVYDEAAGGYEIEYYAYQRFVAPMERGEERVMLGYYSPCRGKGQVEAAH
jgi:predicted transcriptional regulator YdeE